MQGKYTAEAGISINAEASGVWQILTSPAKVKEWLFGTNVKTDWKEGSPIFYEGEWEGKSYQDKGTITKVLENKLFQYTYWSSMGGKEDKPENYALVSYLLDEEAGGTRLRIRQENVQSAQEAEHSEQNWNGVLQKIKELAENQ